jgi:hypothetical protein
MNIITADFFTAYWRTGMTTVHTEGMSPDMMAGPEDDEGWVEWKPIRGTLTDEDYKQLEEAYQIQLPPSFIDWHKAFFFCDGDCLIAQLPASLPNEPLEELRNQLNYGGNLISHGLYPFASDGSGTGNPLVFDARYPVTNNEFPIRIYDHEFIDDLNGLGEIIFSSFSKMLSCLVYFLNRPEAVESGEAIRGFFDIDPTGAGGPGRNYWLSSWGNTHWLNKR